MSKDDIEKAVKEAEQFAEEDKKRKEAVDVKNNADNLVFQCEKAMTDFGDKVSAEDKNAIQPKIDALKEACKGDDTADIKAKTDELSKAIQDLSSKIYQQAGAAAQGQPDMNMGGADAGNAGNAGDDVVDADFTEA